MEAELLQKIQSNTSRCSVCGKIIPFIYLKGEQYTCPSFTVLRKNGDTTLVCYHDYHPSDYERVLKKKTKKK